MTQLSVKTLRHYHEVGLLEPSSVDPATGYRYYLPEQLATAQVVRRLRELSMPIADVRAVLASTPDRRNALISTHLGRLEEQLAVTHSAVQSLRAILDRSATGIEIAHRSVPATPAVAIQAMLDRDDLVVWWQGAVAELRATVAASGVVPAGVPGALFGFDLFEHDRGPATVFIPVDTPVGNVGRVESLIVPSAELAVVRHRGAHDDVDLAYRALGEYALAHEISVAEPLREYYDTFDWDTPDASQWVTDLCWPVFRADA